jgi:hypothetical protein
MLPMLNPEQVERVEPECSREGEDLPSHLLDAVRRGSAAASDAPIVDRDHPTVLRKRVHQGRIPVVQIPAQVLQQDQRATSALSNIAICILDAVAERRRFGAE